MTPRPTDEQPPTPNSADWVHMSEQFCKQATSVIGALTHGYRRHELNVLASYEQAEYRGLVVPHWHISVSVNAARRPSDIELADVRHAFDMHDAEEDNHQPGHTRNLFLPLHLPRGTQGICDCKTDETKRVEPDGFVWSTPKSRSETTSQ